MKKILSLSDPQTPLPKMRPPLAPKSKQKKSKYPYKQTSHWSECYIIEKFDFFSKKQKSFIPLIQDYASDAIWRKKLTQHTYYTHTTYYVTTILLKIHTEKIENNTPVWGPYARAGSPPGVHKKPLGPRNTHQSEQKKYSDFDIAAAMILTPDCTIVCIL